MTYDLSGEWQGLDEVQDSGAAPSEVPCSLISGAAGTGKTTLVRQRLEQDPQWAILTATTGIASVNLGCATLNSTLGFFNEDSLRDLYLCGRLSARLRQLAADGTRNLLVEECSMLTGPVLDMLYRAAGDVGAAEGGSGSRFGLILVGDFCQLPPVRGRWAFEADCWGRFAAGTERLTHIWRQSEEGFLSALQAARCGDGAGSAQQLTELGVRWNPGRVTDYDGTTIVSKNVEVDRHNLTVLSQLRGERFSVTSRRWGKQRSEWGQKKERRGAGWVTTSEWGIPPRLDLKVGAYVMILSNSGPDLEWCNGDCGHVEGYEGGAVSVKLVRNGEVVRISPIVRSVEQKDRPAGTGKHDVLDAAYREREHATRRGWVTGQIEYVPLRLAWATTVHKSQSLSLDRVQLDFRDDFFRQPGMVYVALSRCRTLEGLRLVGLPEVFGRHCKVDERVRPYL